MSTTTATCGGASAPSLFPTRRVEINSAGKPRLLEACSCACCKMCWRYVDTGMCIYGGPHAGYAWAAK